MQGEAAPDLDAVNTIIYTSGTTGKPKGVVHTYRSMALGREQCHAACPHELQRPLYFLPAPGPCGRTHADRAGIAALWWPACFLPRRWIRLCKTFNVRSPTIFFSVPRLWVKFQHGVHSKMPARKLDRLMAIPLIGHLVRRKILKGLGLDQCRLAAGGAAPMPHDVLQWYRKLGLDLIEVYGMTENCGVSHSTLPGSTLTGSVGLPYDLVESRIDPDNGEIQMRSPALMRGYYREEAATAEAVTPDGWLRTGDKGKMDGTGYLSITGRVKDLFKSSKGKYVAPHRLKTCSSCTPTSRPAP
jgi:long-chain acyl-CoA synthetase